MENNWDRELAEIRRNLAKRAEGLSALEPDRLREEYQEGCRIGEKLRLLREMIRAEMECLDRQASLLDALSHQMHTGKAVPSRLSCLG